MFKKDDYIVLLNKNCVNHKANFCYKQRENSSHIEPYKDNAGSTTNGSTVFYYKHEENWRYANSQEIAEYNRIGKPYDVTTLKTIRTLNKDTVKVGQKVRVIAENAETLGFEGMGNNTDLKKGYVGIITSTNGGDYIHDNNHLWAYIDNTGGIITGLLELLEEPKSEEVIPEYVECIKGFNTDLSVNDFNVVGKIYEVESYNPKTKELKLKGFQGSIAYITFDGNSESLATDYKISDKASFDAQQNPKETLVGRYLKTLVNNPVSIGMDIGEYLLITRYNHQDNTYNVTRVRDNHTGFGIEVSDLSKFEVMPVGFTPESKFKVGDWVTIIANTNNSVNQVGDVGQITGDLKVTVKGRPDFSNSTRITDMRLATSSEIYEAQKLERDKFISQAVKKLEVPYTKLPIVTSVKRSNIVPLKLEKQKSLINLPTI